jgi:23S rRNA (adenine1618-N6)-methyltransferase
MSQEIKSKLHTRNKHNKPYDFDALIAQTPELARFITTNKYGIRTINFFDAEAVKLLNKSLLKNDYGLDFWDIPAGYLCPPIPGRADYIHFLADLLSEENKGEIPAGKEVKLLDVGTGANCIYPLIAAMEYNWSAVGCDVDETSVKVANAIVKANLPLTKNIEIRRQPDANSFFRNVIKPTEYFAATVCNPPFHASETEAISSNLRKIKKLTGKKTTETKLNFGGTHSELWYPGGELAFIKNMIAESVNYATQVGWFTSLVSKGGNLENIYNALDKVAAKKVRTLDMGQGNKISRFVAWKF